MTKEDLHYVELVSFSVVRFMRDMAICHNDPSAITKIWEEEMQFLAGIFEKWSKKGE